VTKRRKRTSRSGSGRLARDSTAPAIPGRIRSTARTRGRGCRARMGASSRGCSAARPHRGCICKAGARAHVSRAFDRPATHCDGRMSVPLNRSTLAGWRGPASAGPSHAPGERTGNQTAGWPGRETCSESEHASKGQCGRGLTLCRMSSGSCQAG
jgi:hypothetical protein